MDYLLFFSVKHHTMKTTISFLILLFALNGSFGQGGIQKKIDSLLVVLPKCGEDTNKVKTLSYLGRCTRFIDQEKALKYGKEALELATKLNDKRALQEAYYSLGTTYSILQENTEGEVYLLKGLDISKDLRDTEAIASILTNLSVIYQDQSNYPKSLESLFDALKLFEGNKNKSGMGNCLLNIGNIFYYQGEKDKAIEYFKKALTVYEELNLKSFIALATGNIGSAYGEMGKYDEGLPLIQKAHDIYVELNEPEGIERTLSGLGSIYLSKGNYVQAEKDLLTSIQIDAENGLDDSKGINMRTLADVYVAIVNDTTGNAYAKNFNRTKALSLAKSYCDSAIIVLKAASDLNELSNAYHTLSDVLQLQHDYQGAYANLQLYKQLSDSIFNMERDKKITQKSMQYDFDKKTAEVKTEQDRKELRQRLIRNSISTGLAGTLIFLVVVYRQRNRISKEKKRSEELLLNILPSEVAEELKVKGSADAKEFDTVTVMFTDFKNFTAMSEKLSAQELVNEINYCYSSFDRIIGKYGIEKIKTIGDSYMCAGGLPSPNALNAETTVSAALEICRFMLDEKAKREKEGRPFFEIRIGCHTGPVVAGIVGIKKFAYDIWGDTVNIASRMESSGETGKVNISGATYELVKEKFKCEHRGKVMAKNKGEVDMFFVSN